MHKHRFFTMRPIQLEKTGQRTGAVGDTHFIDVVNCKVSIGGT